MMSGFRSLLAIGAVCFSLIIAPEAHSIEIQEITTENEHEIWLVEDHTLPIIAIELYFSGGAALDPFEERGVSNMMVHLLEEGAGELDAVSFAEAKEEIAADFNFSAYDDGIAIGASFLAEKQEEAISLLQMAISEPRFDQEAIERIRRQALAILRSQENDPNNISARAFEELAFGNDPYAWDRSGSPETLANLDRVALMAAHRRALSRENLHISVVGDITAHEAAEMIDSLLANLPFRAANPLPDITPDLNGQIRHIEHSGPQTVIRFGQEAIPRDHPDFFAAFILDHILGGAFESRLMQEIRETRGITYGVGTGIANFDRASIWLGSLSVSNENVAETISIIRDEWVKLAQSGVSQEELTAAQTYLTGAYPLRFDGNARIASILASMQAIGLNKSYIEERNERIRAVSLEDINRVASEIIKPDKLSFVLVGMPEELENMPHH